MACSRALGRYVRHQKMIFRATQKVMGWLRTAGTKPQMYNGRHIDPVKEWYCNLLVMKRRKCLLFTHSTTLFSVLIAGVRKADACNFESLFRSHATAALAAEGFTPTQIGFLLDEGPDELAKADNRPVLGSMNDLARMCKFRAHYIGKLEPLNVAELNREINLSPMSYIGMENATRALKTRLNSAGVQ